MTVSDPPDELNANKHVLVEQTRASVCLHLLSVGFQGTESLLLSGRVSQRPIQTQLHKKRTSKNNTVYIETTNAQETMPDLREHVCVYVCNVSGCV